MMLQNLLALVTVTVLVPAEGPPARLLMVATPVAMEASALSVTLEVKPGEPVATVLKLSPGHWRVEATAPGYWAPAKSFEVPGDPPAIALFATGRVTLPLDRKAGLPERPSVQFRTAPGASTKTPGPPAGEWPCVAIEATAVVECAVPAGTLDLRVEARGFVPEYTFSTRVVAQRVSVLRATMEPGSSVSGYVFQESGVAFPGACVEALTPSGERIEAPMQQQQRDRGKGTREAIMFPLRGCANARGFFQIRRPPPGEYLLSTRIGERLAMQSVEVRPAVETRLVDPLAPSASMTLDVSIDPPVMPDGSSWTLRMARHRPQAQNFRPTTVPPSGFLQAPGLAPGQYVVEVWGDGSRWLYERVSIADAALPLTIRIPIVRVSGRVTLSGEPLTSIVTFGGDSLGPTHATFLTDAEGRFSGNIPAPGVWRIGVTASEPSVRRRLTRKIEPDAAGSATLDIDLPAGKLKGRLVDAQGQPARGSILLYTSEPGERVQIVVGPPESSFQLTGLSPGPITITASGERGQTSAPVVVSIDEDEEANIDIVLKDGSALSGRVIDDAGRPLPGASVKWLPVADGLLMGSTERTDALGRFSAIMPPGLDALVVVAADGHGIDFTRVRGGTQTEFVVTKAAGTLVASLGKERPWIVDADGEVAFIEHRGAQLSLPFLWVTALERNPPVGPLSARTTEVRIEGLSPGAYQLCEGQLSAVAAGRAPLATCVAGVLQAGTELHLSLPSR